MRSFFEYCQTVNNKQGRQNTPRTTTGKKSGLKEEKPSAFINRKIIYNCTFKKKIKLTTRDELNCTKSSFRCQLNCMVVRRSRS
jgi:hypothetical protein